MKMDNHILESKSVNVYYDDMHALKNISMKVEPNSVTALIGPSGCGKSTLGRCISRLYQPTAGEILFKETNLARMSHRQLLPIDTIFR